MRALFIALAVAGASPVLAGCANVDGTGRYATKTIGNVDRKVSGVVVKTERLVLRSAGEGGATAGGIAGGAMAIGSDDPAIVLIGVLAGAMIGEFVEDEIAKYNAVRYTVRTENGAEMTIIKAQSDGSAYEIGDRVVVKYGSRKSIDLAP